MRHLMQRASLGLRAVDEAETKTMLTLRVLYQCLGAAQGLVQSGEHIQMG